jgi:hypothetical protein
VEAVALHHTPAAVTAHGYDLLGALAVSHALLGPSVAHGLSPSGIAEPGVDAAYLASLNAPFDWDEAQRRVSASVSPAN